MATPAAIAAFFLVALIYGAVGFGGGSSYTALLTLTDLQPGMIPPVSLVCNLLVVTGSAVHFHRRGYFLPALAGPFLLGSVPCALIGGVWPLRQDVFLGVLGLALVLAGTAILVRRCESDPGPPPGRSVAVAAGAGLGLLSGLVGIGGGVFLAPLMLWRRWGTAKQVAATCAFFILANSLAGLAGQWLKLRTLAPLASHWPLFIAVVAGGQLGSLLGSGPLPQPAVRRLTAVLVLVAGLRVLWKLAG
ncbi:MAG: sulfite exporter TauE/SafE family protein [Kiritimatiellia bacterium]